MIERQIIEFLGEFRAKTVAMTDTIIGCPHEEGFDYPEGEICPRCPFWANRDRWEGVTLESADPGVERKYPMPRGFGRR